MKNRVKEIFTKAWMNYKRVNGGFGAGQRGLWAPGRFLTRGFGSGTKTGRKMARDVGAAAVIASVGCTGGLG